MTEYLALIRKDTDTDYGVDFPDFPGCVTAGSNLDEALANARAALALHMEGLADAGEDLPEPATLEAVMADPENAGAVAALVPAVLIKGRTLRFNATMDEHLLGAIDRAATEAGMTRSGFLSASAKSTLYGIEFPVAAADKIRTSRKRQVIKGRKVSRAQAR